MCERNNSGKFCSAFFPLVVEEMQAIRNKPVFEGAVFNMRVGTYVLAQFNHSVRTVLGFWLLISTLLERERYKMEGDVIICAVAL